MRRLLLLTRGTQVLPAHGATVREMGRPVTGFDEGPAKWMTGRSKPPTWFRLIGCLLLIAVVAGVVVKRGVVVGTVAAVVYGPLGLSQLLAWERTRDWSKRHPVLDNLIVVPLLISFLAGLLLVALSLLLRRTRRRSGP
jgi:hypothetical protein